MTFQPKILKENVRQTLQRAPGDPRQVTLIHEGVLMAAGLILAVLSLLAKMGMDNAGGLSGMGTRTLLTTVTSVADLAFSALSPFWGFGIVFAALGFARAQHVKTDSLFEGFRCFGPCVRLILVEFLLTMAAGFIAAYGASFLYAMLPISSNLAALIEPFYEEFLVDPEAVLTQIPTQELLRAMLPLLVTAVSLLLAVLIPLQYFLRLAQYIVLDKPDTGAFPAVFKSFRYMKGNCLAFLKLDLGFWWYYALGLLLTLVAYLDQLLPLMGISLPLSPEIAYLVCYGLYALGNLILAWFAAPKVFTAYAMAYNIASHD